MKNCWNSFPCFLDSIFVLFCESLFQSYHIMFVLEGSGDWFPKLYFSETSQKLGNWFKFDCFEWCSFLMRSSGTPALFSANLFHRWKIGSLEKLKSDQIQGEIRNKGFVKLKQSLQNNFCEEHNQGQFLKACWQYGSYNLCCPSKTTQRKEMKLKIVFWLAK